MWKNTNIPFARWINKEIQLDGSDGTLSNVILLVTSDNMEMPVLGFNVINEMLPDDQQKYALVNILAKSFGKSSKV